MRKRLKILITSGGTKVPIDMVRHIGNMSSGTFGAKIAYEALKAGHSVDFLMASGSKSPLELRVKDKEGLFSLLKKTCKNIIDRIRYAKRLHIVEYPYFAHYAYTLQGAMERGDRYGFAYDVVVLAAAASDYEPDQVVNGKIRSNEGLTINLKPLPKLISKIREWNPDKELTLVGFKLLVDSTDEELVQAARESKEKNGCDFVVANDLRDIKRGEHRLIFVDNPTRFDEFYSDPNDPNFLAREVVKKYTWIHNTQKSS
jgi:phosphopantothenate-cysteine ligase